MKTCFKCGNQKPLSDFYRHSRMADGHLNKCKECTKTDVFNRRHGKGRERVLAYDRQRALKDDRKEHNKRISAAWRQKHPLRRAANIAVGNAVRDGRLTPWPACSNPEGCESKQVVAHHPDYSRPFDVVWLCHAHHQQAHAMFKNLI